MGIFDKLKHSAMDTVMTAATSIGNKSESFTFAALPESLAEMQALPQATLDTPFQTAALTVLACVPMRLTGDRSGHAKLAAGAPAP